MFNFFFFVIFSHSRSVVRISVQHFSAENESVTQISSRSAQPTIRVHSPVTSFFLWLVVIKSVQFNGCTIRRSSRPLPGHHIHMHGGTRCVVACATRVNGVFLPARSVPLSHLVGLKNLCSHCASCAPCQAASIGHAFFFSRNGAAFPFFEQKGAPFPSAPHRVLSRLSCRSISALRLGGRRGTPHTQERLLVLFETPLWPWVVCSPRVCLCGYVERNGV